MCLKVEYYCPNWNKVWFQTLITCTTCTITGQLYIHVHGCTSWTIPNSRNTSFMNRTSHTSFTSGPTSTKEPIFRYANTPPFLSIMLRIDERASTQLQGRTNRKTECSLCNHPRLHTAGAAEPVRPVRPWPDQLSLHQCRCFFGDFDNCHACTQAGWDLFLSVDITISCTSAHVTYQGRYICT